MDPDWRRDIAGGHTMWEETTKHRTTGRRSASASPSHIGITRPPARLYQAGEAGDRRDQFRGFDGLRQVRLVPRGERTQAILGARVRRQRDRRRETALGRG